MVVLVMALLHYFQSTAFLPTVKETRLRDTVTQSENTAILQGRHKKKSLKVVERPAFPKLHKFLTHIQL